MLVFVQVEERCGPHLEENLASNNSVVQMLVERCHTLEQANKRLQEEARTQQQQYEVCLDRVATQVVQALLSQKVRFRWRVENFVCTGNFCTEHSLCKNYGKLS